MSITVADLLKLPSLREAKVLAGSGGLSRIVSSISVLEYAHPTKLQESLFESNEFPGSEIVITGFVNVKDDVEMQCMNIRRLAEVGEVGLILYYVGVFMPRVDTKLIELADALSFALICMPENRIDFLYSEVICEVMEAIIKDQMTEDFFVSELLERIARLPQHQRTVDTALEMLSDRICASVILTDASGRVLNEVAWPRSRWNGLYEELVKIKLPEPSGKPVKLKLADRCLLYRFRISTWRIHDMDLFLIKEGDPFPVSVTRQAVEVVQLAVSIWSEQHDEIVVTELVRAILQDEPMKMRRLAHLFNIDVASIHTMWILNREGRCGDGAAETALRCCRDILVNHCKTIIMDEYENSIVIFMDGPATLQENDMLVNEIHEQMGKADIPSTLTVCGNLADTAKVRSAFMANAGYLTDAKKIFPGRFVYSLQEIQFARMSRKRVERGDLSVRKCLSSLSALERMEDRELRKTLSVFLLDARSNVTRAGELLFLHKNTIKYRLQRISDRIGFYIGDMPESIGLYEAVALERLLK